MKQGMQDLLPKSEETYAIRLFSHV